MKNKLKLFSALLLSTTSFISIISVFPEKTKNNSEINVQDLFNFIKNKNLGLFFINKEQPTEEEILTRLIEKNNTLQRDSIDVIDITNKKATVVGKKNYVGKVEITYEVKK